jgi:hypothetical protein
MGRRIAGLLGGIMIGGAVLILIFRAPGDSLSQDNLQTARIRWEKSGPKNYDMEIVVTGAQDNTHRIEVRDWKVVRMETGGVEVASKSAHAAWSVEGMFDTLQRELENIGAVHGAAEVVLRVVYDARLGYPRRFLRHVAGQKNSIEWEVRSFDER